MKTLYSVAAVAALSGRAAASDDAVSVTPVQKVLQLLSDLLAKGKAEKQDEKVRYTAFNQWCASTKDEKESAIEKAAQTAQQLNADVEKAAADAEALGQEISQLNDNIAGWESESASTAALRKSELADYQEGHADLSESVDAIERAITVLKAKSADVPQALIQVRRVAEVAAVLAAKSTLPDDADRAASLLAAASTLETGNAPNAYEFQAGSVVEMLEKLRLRFQDERTALETEEHNRKSTSEMVQEKLHNEIVNAKDEVSAKTERKTRAMQDGAEAKADLESTLKAKAADETFLRDTLAECATKASDFEKRQQLRAEEIVAINKAIEIISSPDVSGAADTHLPAAASLLQRASSLAQLRSYNGGRQEPRTAQEKARAFLMQMAEQAGSQLLASVAGRVGEDPFVKVRKMIKDLIVRLMEEANSEADHKGWCDEELSTNKATRDEKSAEVSTLAAIIEENTAKESQLTKEIADLNEQLAAIAEEVREATATRVEEKAKNAATLADALGAQKAVKMAIKVLREFYAKAADATAMTQLSGGAPEKPATFDGAYTGMQSSSGGVIGMLEVVESDFARLELQTKTSEDQAARSYDEFMEASEIDTKTKEKEARHKGFDLTRAKHAINEATKDMEVTQEELDAALAYFEKLKPSCVDSGLSYEQRVKMREEEIQSLQEALKILQAEDLS